MRTMKRLRLHLLLAPVAVLFLTYGHPAGCLAGEKPSIFSTWEGFEADKCASIWLIKRFIAPNAVIKFYPKGQSIKEGTPFDTPDAEFRRYYNMSTYESLLKYYKLEDPRLVYIGRIIHDLEVNIWESKVMKETHEVNEALNEIMANKEPNIILEQSSRYFDSLYDKIVGR